MPDIDLSGRLQGSHVGVSSSGATGELACPTPAACPSQAPQASQAPAQCPALPSGSPWKDRKGAELINVEMAQSAIKALDCGGVCDLDP